MKAKSRKPSPAARRGAKENRQALAEAKALKRQHERGAKFDVVVPVYDLKNNKLTASGKWIKAKI